MANRITPPCGKVRQLKSFARQVLDDFTQFLFLATNKNVIVHIGHFSKGKAMTGNVGDPLLFYELENLFNTISGKEYAWYHRSILRRISKFEIWCWNHFAKGLIVGGHGLLMVDTGRNENSGWQLNVSLQELKTIRCPLAILAIGYNTFRGQEDFNPVFRPHINECVKKSVVFGLRNYGSIRALSDYLDEENRRKICFQPCPTTMLSLYEKLPLVERRKSIGICLAFDRFENRFGNSFDSVVNQLVKYKESWNSKGYEIIFFVHNPTDLKTEYAKAIAQKGVEILSISGQTYEQIFEFYMAKTLIVGMRGHSLMIPWGLGTPVISLTTQNKQKWFIEITGHNERSIEVEQEDILKPLNQQTTHIIANYNEVVDEIKEKQKEFYSITRDNFSKVCKAMQ